MKRISLFATLAVTAAVAMGSFASVSMAAPAGGGGAHGAAVRSSLVLSRTNYTFR